jgi:hypothetical protein
MRINIHLNVPSVTEDRAYVTGMLIPCDRRVVRPLFVDTPTLINVKEPRRTDEGSLCGCRLHQCVN